MYWAFYVDIPVSMATNKMAAISNKQWLICNQDNKLQIKGIIIIPSAVWSEHIMRERFFIYPNIYILNIFIFENPKILQQFRIYYCQCHFQTIKFIANSLCHCMQTLSANVTLQTILPCDIVTIISGVISFTILEHRKKCVFQKSLWKIESRLII